MKTWHMYNVIIYHRVLTQSQMQLQFRDHYLSKKVTKLRVARAWQSCLVLECFQDRFFIRCQSSCSWVALRKYGIDTLNQNEAFLFFSCSYHRRWESVGSWVSDTQNVFLSYLFVYFPPLNNVCFLKNLKQCEDSYAWPLFDSSCILQQLCLGVYSPRFFKLKWNFFSGLHTAPPTIKQTTAWGWNAKIRHHLKKTFK